MPQALHRHGRSTAYCPGSNPPLDIHGRSVSYKWAIRPPPVGLKTPLVQSSVHSDNYGAAYKFLFARRPQR
jgi:hypothetical protein